MSADLQRATSLAEANWTESVFRSVSAASTDIRLAPAAALVNAASRLVLTGSGPGIDLAGFGATIFAELGFETIDAHSGDIRSGLFGLQPGDLIIGFDSDNSTVAGALRKARASGLRTMGVTSQDLTVLDADVLLFTPPGRHRSTTSIGLAMSLGLASLAARLAPASSIARDFDRLDQRLNRIMSDCGRLAASVLFGSTGDRRVVFAGHGASAWVAQSLARRLNRSRPASPLPHAVAAAYQDVIDGWWRFDRSDTLIAIDPYEETDHAFQHAGNEPYHPHRMWRLQRRKPASPDDIQIAADSPALASLMAFTAIAAQFEFASRHVSGFQPDNV